MRKGRLYVFTHIIILLIAFISMTTLVYAWIYDRTPPAVGEVRIGTIDYSLAMGSNYLTEAFLLENLLYIDLIEDLVKDKTNTLADVGISLFFDIEVGIESIPIKIDLLMNTNNIDQSIIYLIIIEGINLDINHQDINDYSSIIGLWDVDSSSTYEEIKLELALYNQNVINQLYATHLVAGDSIRIQIVFWGDYDALSNPEDYLTTTYSVDFQITLSQVEKE
ncbi:MAG: hypothetical protein U1C51_05175 [Candidatus Izemoplasmatales bacterium]|nr:hypothetical protein [bacterium]MDZ4196627.1 hypothetical protein [Candidatus Izemoplasmatales bacterium]